MANSATRGFRKEGTDIDTRDEAPTSSQRLDGIRRRLLRTFQKPAPHADWTAAREAATTAAAAATARRQLCSLRMESALAGLRVELLEMRFQNRRLARTLLDLNMKMQQLKKECDLEIASESQGLKENAVDQE